MIAPSFDLCLSWDRPAHVTGNGDSLREWFISVAWYRKHPRTSIDRGAGPFFEAHYGAGITILGLTLMAVAAVPRARW